MKRKLLRITALALAVIVLAGTTAYAMRPINAENDQNAATNKRAPIARNLSLKTYRNIPITGRFEAVDPEGKDLTFSIVSKPEKGTVTTFDDSTYFVYTPAENKTGTDSFTYTATDPEGNVSEPATVTVEISKPSTKVIYSDMRGNPAHYAAIRLAEAGIFTGEQIGSDYCFFPDATVSRGEFIAMIMKLLDTECSDAETVTAFADDEDIEPWLRPYVNAAIEAGILRSGSAKNPIRLVPDKAMTRAEAAVVINCALSLTDAPGSDKILGSGNIPAWAYQAALNVASCGIVEDASFCSNEPLTRAAAAEMLLGALNILEQRYARTGGLLSWAR
ncbi:MAG: Ig-like domain-containing protein [Oscillospiraceae bacterium]|jgi:hypothetical protein